MSIAPLSHPLLLQVSYRADFAAVYLPFQECHSPFQVDANYSALYPHLPEGPRRTLPGMVTHTDEMIGDVVRALKQHHQWDDTLVSTP